MHQKNKAYTKNNSIHIEMNANFSHLSDRIHLPHNVFFLIMIRPLHHFVNVKHDICQKLIFIFHINPLKTCMTCSVNRFFVEHSHKCLSST